MLTAAGYGPTRRCSRIARVGTCGSPSMVMSERMATMSNIKRRQFLKSAAVSAAVVAELPTNRVLGANDRVRLGAIGFGARGQEDMREALKLGNVEFVAA